MAEEADEHLFSRLSEIVDRMADSSLDPLAFHGLDVQFHETLIEVSGNALVALALRSCRTVNRQAMLDRLASGEWPQTLRSFTTSIVGSWMQSAPVIRPSQQQP